jgi:hypothetical protein
MMVVAMARERLSEGWGLVDEGEMWLMEKAVRAQQTAVPPQVSRRLSAGAYCEWRLPSSA